MTKEREALKLALVTLKDSQDYRQGRCSTVDAVDEIEEVLAQISDSVEQEPLEYWNAVEGWVKIDEVRKHFETVSCGTIYKTAGEDRVPLYAAPPKREWVSLTDEQKLTLIEKHLGLERYKSLGREHLVIDRKTGRYTDAARYFDLIDEAAHGIKEKNT